MYVLRAMLLAGLLLALLTVAGAAADPIFDLEAIINDPVDVKVLDTMVENGVVFETLEFTSRVVAGAPERVSGIYAYPEGGKSLPGVFWCMGGMAAANRYFPEIFARKGYASLAITLPHKIRASYIAFNTADPKTANITLLARDELRGVTVLSQRPQVDPDRLAVAGASYGGVFATLVAGVDPRIKAGMSFFGGGNHALGSNLPQFTGMKTLEDVAIWNATVDGAVRLRTKDIPFMWGIAFNDNWFYFPAVAKTFMETAGTGKRAAIIPYWQHGFMPNVDQGLLDFLDTAIAKTRAPFNAPGPLTVKNQRDTAVASFTWTGDNTVAKAELVVSYGENTPWIGWTQRTCFVFPAAVQGNRATASLPIPSRSVPLIAWGNLTDAKGVVTSTPPLTLTVKELAGLPVSRKVKLNAFIDGDLGDGVLDIYNRHNDPLGGVPDREVKQAGTQSLRFNAADGKKGAALTIPRFLHVPGLAHRLSVWVRATEPTPLTVILTPVRPGNWRSEVVRKLLAGDPRLAPLAEKWNAPVTQLAAAVTADATWREVILDVPLPTEPVEGYKFEIRPTAPTTATWWVDTIQMQPIWPR